MNNEGHVSCARNPSITNAVNGQGQSSMRASVSTHERLLCLRLHKTAINLTLKLRLTFTFAYSTIRGLKGYTYIEIRLLVYAGRLLKMDKPENTNVVRK